MKSILILIIVGLIHYSEGYSKLCDVDNGRLLLNRNVKVLGNITTKNTTTFYVSKTEKLNFLCYKNHDTDDTKIIFNDNTSDAEGQQSPANRTLKRLVNNDEGTNKEPVKVECEDICEVKIIVISFNASEICNSNGSISCNEDKLSSKIPGSSRRFPDAIAPRIKVAGSNFPPLITYWILDPAGNGSYASCDELDIKGDVIRAGSNNGQHDTETFECPIDRDLSRYPRPVIIKKREETKTKPCVGLPIFCKSDIKESYITYRYIPPQLELFIEAEEEFPMWGLMLMIILCLTLFFVAIFIVYVFYNKRQNLLTLQPQKSSEFYMETPPSEPDSAKTETTLPSYYSNRSNGPWDDIIDEDLKALFQDVEKRKKTTFKTIKW